MKRICLKTDSLQLVDIKSQQEKNNAAWLTIVLGGAFRIKGVQAEYDESGGFYQNWSGSPLRFIDCPLLHHGKDKSPLLLQDIIGTEVYQYFLRHDKRMRDLLSMKNLKGVNLKKFKPQSWSNRKLTVPVEFIRISGLSAWHKNGDVSATVQFGHHLTAYAQKIFVSGRQKFCFDGDIVEDEQLREAIVKMIEGDQKLQDLILRISKIGFNDCSKTSFIDKTEECDPESLPSPVSFC